MKKLLLTITSPVTLSTKKWADLFASNIVALGVEGNSLVMPRINFDGTEMTIYEEKEGD